MEMGGAKDDRVSPATCERPEQRRSKADMAMSPRHRRESWPKESEHLIEGIKSQLWMPSIEPLPTVRALPPIMLCSSDELTGDDGTPKLVITNERLWLNAGRAVGQLRDLTTDANNCPKTAHTS